MNWSLRCSPKNVAVNAAEKIEMTNDAETPPRPVGARLVRNISQYLDRSLSRWYMFEPHLHWEAGVEVPDIWGAFMSLP